MDLDRCLLALIALSLSLGSACGGDDGSSTDSVAQTSTDTHATTHDASVGTSSAETSSGGATTVGTSTVGTSSADSGETMAPIDVPCGDALVCTGGDVCIEDAFEPACTNLRDPMGTCPPGQDMTFCGGAGFPCCCDPPPPSEYRCVAPTGCGAAVDCACLGDVCTDGRECIALGPDPEHLFRCEVPPAP